MATVTFQKSFPAFLLILGWVTIILCMVDSDVAGSRTNTTQEIYKLQHALGGLGGGALTIPLWNLFDYDPRLSLMREDERFPVPGGYSFSPDRLCMVSFFFKTGNH